ncbi:hypothetical protein NLU13_4205 [Sarocladium strictum]|uniref:Uncharacterized protein n=1 Tax=Sarocladium strictum TaxID=5046 RepID=A0AA39L7Z1_SARSR|nr:hypothetical protein NLU13_4205 [Sarocladium strictum]
MANGQANPVFFTETKGNKPTPPKMNPGKNSQKSPMGHDKRKCKACKKKRKAGKNRTDGEKGPKDKAVKPKPNDIVWVPCTAKGCERPWFTVLRKDVLGGRNPGCEDHQCKDPDCWRVLADQSCWCALHTCGIRPCPERTPKRQKDCGKHLPCRVHGCAEYRRLGEDGREQRAFCSDHLCEHGYKDSWHCNQQKEREMKYCQDHQCRLVRGCSKLAARGPFCDDHLCRARVGAARCQFEADKDGYCEDHADMMVCNYRYCDRVGEPVGTNALGPVYYCPNHNDWICQGFERLDMPFCGVHVVDQLPYCETHRCQVLGCLKVKDKERASRPPRGYETEKAGVARQFSNGGNEGRVRNEPKGRLWPCWGLESRSAMHEAQTAMFTSNRFRSTTSGSKNCRHSKNRILVEAMLQMPTLPVAGAALHGRAWFPEDEGSYAWQHSSLQLR